MKKAYRYFIENIKIAISMVYTIILCFLSLFFILSVLDLILFLITPPVVSFIVSALFLVVVLSVILTLFDIFSNKSD